MRLVTRSTCVAVYELLIQLPPIKAWRLPPSKDILFVVRNMPDIYGMFEPDPHKITLSSAKHAHLDTCIRTMAHEMIHLHLYSAKIPTGISTPRPSWIARLRFHILWALTQRSCNGNSSL
jgi:hypothetical protein